ncbi:galectin-7-like, partial [Equus quagga]|uniref:galectin-7-like n=1 Tax=Equus quagga TaxID=89248 RepID=UPI001EE32754
INLGVLLPWRVLSPDLDLGLGGSQPLTTIQCAPPPPPPPPTTRFFVNLLCSEGPEAEYALHFNPRLDKSEVVFNTMEQGRWGREERGQGIPFQRGQPFDVLIITTEDGFKAVVGDSEYYHFRHRIPPANVRL